MARGLVRGLPIALILPAGLGWLTACDRGTDSAQDLAGGSGGSSGSAGGTGGAGGTSGAGGTGGAAGVAGVPPSLISTDSGVVFDDTALLTFELSVQPDRWQWLQENAELEEYVEAELTVGEDRIGTVGLRYKGQYGTLILCFDDAGNQTCPKLSMKIKFDEYDPDKRFYGLKRLNLHAMAHDPSIMHDRLGYDMYRQMGIVASRATHARLVVNGEYLGVFSMVEQVDGRFTDDRFPGHGDGNLYKEVWPHHDDPAYYQGGLENNEDTADVTHPEFVAFSAALAAASDGTLPTAIDGYTDLGYLLRYVAVDDAIANWDGITAWYSGVDEWTGEEIGLGNHNYYWYLDEFEDRFTLVPWDLDGTFSVRSAFRYVPSWDTLDVDCDARHEVFNADIHVRAPSCDPLIRGLALSRQNESAPNRYLTAVRELLDGPFQLGVLNDKLDRWSAQIADAVATDPNGPGTAAWEAAVERLRADLGLLRQRLQNIVDGVETTAFELVLDRVNDVEDVDPLEFALGVVAYANTRSTVSIGPNQIDPIRGLMDARLDFELRNEGERLPDDAWAQWVIIRLAFAAGPEVDLWSAGVTGVRLSIKSDQPREVRLGVESPDNTLGDEGITLGWDIQATAEPTTVVVNVADAALPTWADWDPDVPLDDPASVFGAVTGLTFLPHGVGRDAIGLYPPGVTDSGYLEIDDIEFLTQ